MGRDAKTDAVLEAEYRADLAFLDAFCASQVAERVAMDSRAVSGPVIDVAEIWPKTANPSEEG